MAGRASGRARLSGGRDPSRQQGQAAVELAVVAMGALAMLLLIGQAALVVRDHVLVTHAARDLARLASTGADEGRLRQEADRVLADAEVDVSGGGAPGEPVRVRVDYVSHTDVPLVGPLLPDLSLSFAVTMRAER